MHLYWGVLFIAVIVEVMWALSLKAIQDNPSAFLISASVVLTALNMGLLSFAMRGIPIGTAYAVWTGLGSVGIATAGIFLYNDPMTGLRLLFMAFIISGVVGLKIVS